MPTIMPVIGLPGLRARASATHRIVFRQNDWLSDLAGGKLIDGVNSRDAGNNPNYCLRAGLLMGKITSGGLYAPSIIDVTAGALTGTGTSFTLSAAGAVELVRRQGASGTLSLTGPPAANGVARTLAVAYSAVNQTTGVVTSTAAAVNEVQRVDMNIASTGGNVQITFTDATTGARVPTASAAWSATDATYLANINSALDTATGVSGGIVATAIPSTDTDLGFILTFSGGTYAGKPWPLVNINLLPTSSTNAKISETTAGASGAFVAGSLVGDNDGSQIPLTLIPDGYGIRVVDENFASVTVPFAEFPVAGVITPTQIINWPADTGLQSFIKNALSSASLGKFVFSDGY